MELLYWEYWLLSLSSQWCGELFLNFSITVLWLFVNCRIKIYMQNRALAGFRRHEDDRDEILKADFQECL